MNGHTTNNYLTLFELAEFDDVATALIVDPYLGQQTHKMSKFPANTKIWPKLRHIITEHRSHSNFDRTFEGLKAHIPKLPDYSSPKISEILSQNSKNPKNALIDEKFQAEQLKDLKFRFRSFAKYDLRALSLLKKHLKLFIDLLDHKISGIDLSDCAAGRYSSDDKYECGAKIVSMRKFERGETLEYLTGVVCEEKTEQDAKVIVPGVNDFSVTISTRTMENQLWLGPAAYINHDCNPNCKLRATGTSKKTTAIYEITRKVEAGDELLLNYGNNYFRVGNTECECDTCRRKQKGAFAPNRVKHNSNSTDERISSDDELQSPNNPISIGKYKLRLDARSSRKN